ncbi:ABC transporter permease [Qipengyuania sp. GH1]|uniref:FtsX-like permease family protein n=1 Tax=Qipengyuania aestuarii TaxID=2867241 RepID=UPI001C87781F|nr:FtsX-like permease family protein [Qipengyuania aestuarii]MBX7535385.1 ABC transporter permease [Qipengyuania aestuarii]
MNRFALLSLYRSLTRHKLYAALNIGGLAVGIAVFLVLGLYVRFETSYETWLPHYDEVYLVQTDSRVPDQPFSGRHHWTMGGLLEQLREDFPGIVGTRIEPMGASIIQDGVAVNEDLKRADDTFFDVFDLPMAAGEGRRALADPGNVLISQSVAERFFGSSDTAIGQTMTATIDHETRSVRVAGVFVDLPPNSELEFTMLTRLPDDADSPWWSNWGSTSLQTFLRFSNREDARQFEAATNAFVNRRATDNYEAPASDQIGINLLPIADWHLTPEGREPDSRRQSVATLGIVGLLTLLIAIVNYVNLATSRAALRAREVAMRKVLGADRAALIRQFLTEAIATVAIAGLLALIIVELTLPFINAAGGLELSIAYLGGDGVVVPLILLSLVIGLIAGAYPAFLLSRYPAASVLASAKAPGGGRAGTRTRQALVAVQFALAIAFMIGTAVLFAQTQHLRDSDLGFDREGLLLVRSMYLLDDEAQRRAVQSRLEALPSVRFASMSDGVVGGGTSTNVDSFAEGGSPPISMRRIAIGPAFFETYGTRLLAGRYLDAQHGMDDATSLEWEEPQNVVINTLLMRSLGYSDPAEAIGKQIGRGAPPRTIVGVVNDMRFLSPREPVDPTYYTYYEEPKYGVMTLRFTGDPRVTTERAREAWTSVAGEIPFEAETGTESLQEFYEDDERATRLFAIGAGLAVLIGMVGLWGLASFNTARRVKEIGIRKSLGASATDIVKLLVGQFMRPVLIANIIAWPLAYWAMRTWLAGFDDRIELSPVHFIGASLIAIAIAVLTVLGQSLRASRTAPSWALRHD